MYYLLTACSLISLHRPAASLSGTLLAVAMSSSNETNVRSKRFSPFLSLHTPPKDKPLEPRIISISILLTTGSDFAPNRAGLAHVYSLAALLLSLAPCIF